MMNPFLLFLVTFLVIGLISIVNSVSAAAVENTPLSPGTSLFGHVEVTSTPDMYFQPMKESAADKSSIFRTFSVMRGANSTLAKLGSLQVDPGQHVIAKFDSQVNDYVWATAIDSVANGCEGFLVFPSCDSKSVIALLTGCKGTFVQFKITGVSGSYSVMIKYDVKGAYVWHRMVPVVSPFVTSIACENQNRDAIYMSGGFKQYIKWDNVTLFGNDSTFVTKLDHEASVVWAVKATGIQVTSLASDDQYTYLGGTLNNATFGNYSLDLTLRGGGLFLGSLDKNDGGVVTIAPFAIGSNVSVITNIDVGSPDMMVLSGNIYVNETFGNTTIYADSVNPSMFVVKYNRTNGEVKWVKSLDLEGELIEMKVDRNGSIHLIGGFLSPTTREMWGFYQKLTAVGEQLSFLTTRAMWSQLRGLSVSKDDFISILGDCIGSTFQLSNGPTFKIVTSNLVPYSIFFGRVLEPKIEDFSVVPSKGAMLYDNFMFCMNELFSTYRHGFFDTQGDASNQRVFISEWTTNRNLNATLPVTGNITVFMQGLMTQSGVIVEWTSNVEVYQGQEGSKVAQALTEQGNNINQLNGTLLEQRLTYYTHALVDSIQLIQSNQTTQLLSSLINIMESKQGELSGSATLKTVKVISQQYSYLSENSTIQTSNIMTNVLNSNDTVSSRIVDSIVVAHNIANVMISSNSSQSQKESFTSMVSVLTEKIRGNMTEGQTSELSLPYLETVITKINQSSILNLNTTIVVKQPSSGASNNGNVTIVIPTSLLSHSNASFIQCEAIANPPDPYPTKCNTNQVSATISANLFTYNQQRIEVVNSDSSVPIESMVTIPDTLNSTMGDLYKYACKYLDRNSNLWKNDSSICHTGVTSLDKSTNEAISVRCQCSQPVTHAVSLDYVQSSDGLDESSIGVGQVCTNPCGCKESEARSSKQRGMKTYGIVLIVLAGFTVIVVVIAAFALTLLLLLRKRRRFIPTNTKNTGVTDNIELRFQTMNK